MAGETTIARENKANPVNSLGRAQSAFSRVGTTRIGDYDIEVRNVVSQDRSGRGLNLKGSTYTEIRKDGKVVAWNSTQRGGESAREKWVSEQRRKFNI